MSKNENGVETIQATENSLAVIESLRQLDGAGVTEVAVETGLAKSSVHKHLQTLAKHRYVIKKDDEFHLGLKFLDHGMFLRKQEEFYDKAGNKIHELAEDTGEKVQFVVEEWGKGVFLHQERGKQAVQTDSRIGSQVYLHATASGKAILAHLPEERVEDIIDRIGIPKKTDSTITDRKELRTELAEVRKEGLAFNRGEHIRGVWTVGAAVLSKNETILGAISLSVPASRLNNERLKQDLSNALLESVNELELDIAYS